MNREDKLRMAYKGANAIIALAGWEPSLGALAIQERVIKGELTTDKAIQAHIAQVLEGHPENHQRSTTRQEEP